MPLLQQDMDCQAQWNERKNEKNETYK